MNLHDTLSKSHLSEGVEGNQLAGWGIHDSECFGDSGDLVVFSWWGKEEAEGGVEELVGGGVREAAEGVAEGGAEGVAEGVVGGQWLNNVSPCLIGWRLISGINRRENIGVREIRGLCSQKHLGRGARGTERRFRVEIREGLDKGNLLPLSSAFAEVIEIPENVRVKHAIKLPF
jgi:hypothetical protein